MVESKTAELDAGDTLQVEESVPGDIAEVIVDPGGDPDSNVAAAPVDAYDVSIETADGVGGFEEVSGSPVTEDPATRKEYLAGEINGTVRVTVTNTGSSPGTVYLRADELDGDMYAPAGSDREVLSQQVADLQTRAESGGRGFANVQAGRQEPQNVEVLSDTIQGGDLGTFNSLFAEEVDREYDIQKGPGQTLAINNYPVGGSLKGLYYFTSQFGLFNNGYNTSFATATGSTGIDTINVTGLGTDYMPAKFGVGLSITPTTGTVTRLGNVTVSLTDLSADFFDTYVADPAVSLIDVTGLSITGSTTLSLQAAPRPNYKYKYVKPGVNNGRLSPEVPFLPSPTSSFNVVIDWGFNTSISGYFSMFMYSFAQPTPDRTIRSTL